MIRPAMPQLVELATAMRTDWDADDLSGAIAAAHAAGWDWPHVFLTVARLLVDEDASPRDLSTAVRSPFARQRPAEPTPEYQEARAELDAREAS